MISKDYLTKEDKRWGETEPGRFWDGLLVAVCVGILTWTGAGLLWLVLR